MNKNIELYIRALSAIGLFAVSGALVYFAWSLSTFTAHMPDTIMQIENIERELERSNNLIEMHTPEVIATVNKSVATIEETTKQIPDILTQIENIEGELERSNNLIETHTPEVIATVSKSVASIEETTKKIPDVMERVDEVIEQTPEVLGRLEHIVNNASRLGRKTSEGMFAGIFTGIIKSPVNIIQGLFGSSDDDKLPASDLEAMDKAIFDLFVDKDRENDPVEWRNDKTGAYGHVVILDKKTKSNEICYEFEAVHISSSGEEQKEKERFCIPTEDQ